VVGPTGGTGVRLGAGPWGGVGADICCDRSRTVALTGERLLSRAEEVGTVPRWPGWCLMEFL